MALASHVWRAALVRGECEHIFSTMQPRQQILSTFSASSTSRIEYPSHPLSGCASYFALRPHFEHEGRWELEWPNLRDRNYVHIRHLKFGSGSPRSPTERLEIRAPGECLRVRLCFTMRFTTWQNAHVQSFQHCLLLSLIRMDALLRQKLGPP